MTKMTANGKKEPETQSDGMPEDMIQAERQQRMIDWFEQNVGGSNQELSRLFNASVSTIRRDLDALAARGVVRRTHGGAVRIRQRSTYEPSVDEARYTASEEKRAIAVEAAKRLSEDQSILIDTGSTMHEFAQVVGELNISLTVVTCDLMVASLLTRKPHVKLIVPGGQCRPRAYTLLGEPGMSFLHDMRVDQCFLSAQAVDYECVSDTSLELVTLKRAMIRAASKTTLMIDSSRFAGRAIHGIADVADINEIITDDGLADNEFQQYRQLGVKVTRVQLDDAASDLAGDSPPGPP
ncbi:DeoR/GlpR transcriptional regulator [Paraburkholderia sp. Ac-20336]|uniref:DeoR/GlpR family DNA-binding transcription regulator n=1 Tax=Paraburkholderia sp. Ac-20336 TaxID=2703886 RepID=UPI0019816E15|nr:DeoR/GlpR family DNA-binding transcription regulator [Paraburkholderia sp. Ac-20336]MBN3801892.1 DeoR/GlpR transcriptional regulator [Paraburkholderia sp. Ac-20336]